MNVGGSNNFQCYQHTVSKFQNIFVIQILREINFGEFRSSENAVFAILDF